MCGLCNTAAMCMLAAYNRRAATWGSWYTYTIGNLISRCDEPSRKRYCRRSRSFKVVVFGEFDAFEIKEYQVVAGHNGV